MGKLSLMPVEKLHGVLTKISEAMENRLLPKKPWTSEKMDQDVYSRMQRQILPVKLEISKIEGTWKLSQNKADDVRLRAAEAVSDHGVGTETEMLSRLMKQVKS